MDACELIPREDTAGTLFYCDPPYLKSTRVATDVYGPHEMSDQQHQQLLSTLSGIKGKFLLSGYRNSLYDDFAVRHGWQGINFDLPNNAAGGGSKRRMIETVWANYELAAEGVAAS
jgi:DNA adenine methylase